MYRAAVCFGRGVAEAASGVHQWDLFARFSSAWAAGSLCFSASAFLAACWVATDGRMALELTKRRNVGVVMRQRIVSLAEIASFDLGV